MVTTKLIEDLGLEKAWERLHKAPIQEPPAFPGTSAAKLVKNIRDGTLTIGQIDSFLLKARRITADQKEYLLREKGSLLLRQDRCEEALQSYDEALKVNQKSPLTWVAIGPALFALARLDEAFQAFQRAYSLKEHFKPPKQENLRILLQRWSTAASLRGVFGIMQRDSRELQKGVEEYLGVLDKARKESLGDAATVHLKAEDPASEELQEVIEEWELAVRLLAIKNPFDRWRALTKEISKVWPEGVSAVDAVREQRE